MAEQDDSKTREKGEDAPRGFTVSDRRGKEKDTPPAASEGSGTAPRKEAKAGAGAESAAEPGSPGAGESESPPPPPMTFSNLIFYYSTSALVQLGEIPDPVSKKMEKNLPAAQQTIDLLGLLEQKTQGNLSEDEKKALEAVLYDLRMRFLKAAGRL